MKIPYGISDYKALKVEAFNQLNAYSEDERIDKNKLRKYVVIFIGHDLKVLEEVI